MDLVFMEDTVVQEPKENFYFEYTCSETTSYIFLWLLILETIGQCNPQVFVPLTNAFKLCMGSFIDQSYNGRVVEGTVYL